MAACIRREIDPYLLPCQNSSKWMKNLNIKPITLNPMKEKVGDSIAFIGTGKDFLKSTLITQTIRPTISKLEIKRLKNFCTAKISSFGENSSVQMGKDLYQLYIQ